MELLLAGLDIGTTSVKLAFYDTHGQVVFEEYEVYKTHYRQPGWAEQSPQCWKNAIISNFRKGSKFIKSTSYRIVGLGLSAHAPSLVFIDKHGNSLTDYVPIWCDERSIKEANQIIEQVGLDCIGLGLPFASFTAKLLWYIKEQQNILKEATCATGIKGYISKWLTGQLATDPSSEPGRHEKWAPTMDACQWSVEKLAPVFWPTEIIGNLRNKFCEETGLPEQFPIIAGLNDGGSSLLSNGAYTNGDTTIELATNGVIYLVTDKKISSEVCFHNALFCWDYVDNRWVVGGQTKSGASAFDWANKLFRNDTPSKITEFVNIAEQSPIGSNGIMFFPYLRGTGTLGNDPETKAILLGLQINSTKEQLYRSIIEGVIISLRAIVDCLQKSNLPINKMFITGGGAQSEFVRKIAADVFGFPLYWSQTSSTLGAAILAAVGVGVYENISSAVKHMSPIPKKTMPNLESHCFYNDLVERYAKFQSNLLNIK